MKKALTTSTIYSTIDKYVTIEDYSTKIKEIEAQLPKPKYAKDDIVMIDGYRKVRITKVFIKDNKHWFSKHHHFTFAYEVENVLTDDISVVEDGVTHIKSFLKGTIIVKEEEIQDVPESYETYLCHIIYKLTHKEISTDN